MNEYALFFENSLLLSIPDIFEIRSERRPERKEIFRIRFRTFLGGKLEVVQEWYEPKTSLLTFKLLIRRWI